MATCELSVNVFPWEKSLRSIRRLLLGCSKPQLLLFFLWFPFGYSQDFPAPIPRCSGAQKLCWYNMLRLPHRMSWNFQLFMWSMENGKGTKSKHYPEFLQAARQGRTGVGHDVSCDQCVIFAWKLFSSFWCLDVPSCRHRRRFAAMRNKCPNAAALGTQDVERER